MNKKKKKLLISTYDDIKNPYYGGGGAIAVHELAKRLNEKYDLKILTWNHSGVSVEIIDGVLYQRVGHRLITPRLGLLLFQLTLPIHCKLKKYDIWMESFSPPFTTAFLPSVTKKPVVGVVHMLAAEDMKRKYKLPFHLVEKLGLKHYKIIVTTSEYMQKKLKSINPACDIQIISNGIEKIVSNKSKKENQILYLGRIEVNQKGLDLLIKAFKKFVEDGNSSYKLIIAGDGHSDEIKKLKYLIKKNKLQNNVELIGRVSGKQKEQLLCESQCMAITSRFETFSMVALEAMAHKLPIVCFDIEGLSWIPQNTAVKVSPFDINGFSEAVSNIIKNRKYAEFLEIEGNRYAQMFTWDAIAKSYTKFIKGILANA